RESLVDALMHGRWEQAAQGIDRTAAAATSQAQAWAGLIERLTRGLARGGRQWTMARKKESLQRVLDGSRSDLAKLQQRLQPLVSAWEADAPLAGESDMLGGDAADADPAASASAGWPPLLSELEGTVRTALPSDEARAKALADRLAELAARIAADGPLAESVDAVAEVCQQARRLFGHRHHLIEQLGQLCHELGQGMHELAEDDSWVRGQCDLLQAHLADGISARSVRAASELLGETRQRQQRVRGERNAARDALKALIERMLRELGELGGHTDRFQQSVARHAQAIASADSLESLAGVVRDLVQASRDVQSEVSQTQARLNTEHAKASELEARVRELEAELRNLSDEVATDALTQVANRRGLAQAFATEVAVQARSAGAAPPLAVALIDIDNFKKLNDALGHAAGDVALKSLATVVRERLRPADHLARFGGEEFVVLLPATPVAEAQQVLTRLQRSLTASLFMHDNKEVFVTFSAGVTAWSAGETLETTLERADEALYEAKRSGKNRTCIG
ncbi:MAG: diguanylate cyclase, partial [Rubrivivax sp.]|nr:diguanylate cyclase [Rubrivivax sp.]